MNNEDLKKLLKAIEICEEPGSMECNGCPFVDDSMHLDCAERKYRLAKSLLTQMEDDNVYMIPSGPYAGQKVEKVFTICDEARDLLMECIRGGHPLVMCKGKPDASQWFVGSLICVDFEERIICILGISTGEPYDFKLTKTMQLKPWTSGPNGQLICIKKTAEHTVGEIYTVLNGVLDDWVRKINPEMKTDYRIASFDEPWVAEHFVPYKGTVLDKNEKQYLNGWLVCTEDHPLLTVGRRYRIDRGCFVDDKGLHHNYFTSSATDMETLKSIWHMIYVPDKK